MKHMWNASRLSRTLYGLQGTLTILYALVTVLVAGLIGMISLAAVYTSPGRADVLPNRLIQSMMQATHTLSPYMRGTLSDKADLNEWLGSVAGSRELVFDRGNLDRVICLEPPLVAVVNDRGRVMASNRPELAPVNVQIQTRLSATETALLDGALRAGTNPMRLVWTAEDGHTIAAVPIYGSNDQIAGALFTSFRRASELQAFLRELLVTLRSNLPIMLALTIIFGGLFGFFTARRFTSRLAQLSQAADAWGRGDFSVLVDDAKPDEIGRLADDLNGMAEQLHNLVQAREQLAAVEERQKLARDLHDSVTQSLYGVTLYAEAASRLLGAGDDTQAAHYLQELRVTSEQALREMRLLLYELRPPELEEAGLPNALRVRLESVEERAGLKTTLQVEGEWKLPADLEEGLYRIAQEALNNALKHAKARQIWVGLRQTETWIGLEVRDDGVGFDLGGPVSNGMGLCSMRERAQCLGGQLIVRSAPGAGTSVRVEVER